MAESGGALSRPVDNESGGHRLRGAPEELDDYLQALAAKLAGSRSPRRIRFGSAALELLKRHSPEGFLLESDHGDLQMLLPDGRLWEYRRSLHSHPTGRYFHAPVDYVRFVNSRLKFDGIEFAYLGATIGKYSFGMVHHDQPHRTPPSGALCALTSSGPNRLVPPGAAFAEIATWLLSGQSR